MRPVVDHLEIIQIMKANDQKLDKAELEHQKMVEQQESSRPIPPMKNDENFIQKALDGATDNTENKNAQKLMQAKQLEKLRQ